MSWRYSVFGLKVEADRSIPGLALSQASAPADVLIDTAGSLPKETGKKPREYYVSPDLGQNGRPLLRVWVSGEFFRFLYDDSAEFVISNQGSRVWARWPESLTIDDIAPYIQGPVLGFALRLRGVTSLHASAVAVDEKAVAILGPPGAGKSTTAGAFARLGYSILSDDITALTESHDGFLVHSGYPWIRLWPESVEVLFGEQEALPRISPDDPNWDKRFLDLSSNGYSFSPASLPLGAVYILTPRSSANDAPKVLESTPPERLLSLAGNTYMNHVQDKTVRAREFEVLGRIARSVPVRVVVPHASGDRLDRLCEVILSDYSAVRRTYSREAGKLRVEGSAPARGSA